MVTPIPPRPTIYRGVQMRSRLEAAWAEQFDAFNWKWEYEPFAVANQGGQYLPDFRVTMPDSDLAPFYVEVKPGYWLDPETWGYKGDYRDIDNWNAAAKALDDEMTRMEKAVKDNTACSAFFVCTGSGDAGHAWIVTPYQAGRTSHWPVTPVRCQEGCISLVLDPYGTGCQRHYNTRWHILNPVDSLYAPNGFGRWESHDFKPDHIDKIIRGG